MTDPSTLFLSTPQVRPSWTLNGLTLELNLAPAHGTPNTVDNSNYATPTFQAIHPNNAAASTVFASVMGQGQCAAAPLRFSVRGGNSCWAQANSSEAVSNDLQTAVAADSVFAVTQSASFLSTSTLSSAAVPAVSTASTSSFSISNSTVTNALIPSNPVVDQSVSQMNNCAGFYISSMAGAIAEDASKKPVFLAPSSGQQVPENVLLDDKKRQNVTAESMEMDKCEPKSCDQMAKKMAVGTPCQVAEITTSTVNNIRDNSSGTEATQTASTFGTATSSTAAVTSVTTSSMLPVCSQSPVTKITTPSVPISGNAVTIASNNGIPVGIAVARQRYVSSTSCKSQTQNLKETISTSTSNSPYASSVPYQPIIEPSLFPPAISNIGVVAGTTGCDDRNIANIGGNILPPIIAWPQPQQQQQHAMQQWYPCTGAMEAVTQNVPPACAGYQLVRDPVSGHVILIAANQIGGTQSTATAGFTTTNQQLQQSFLIPQFHQQQQSQSHSLFLDHLVSVVPSSTNIKQNSVSSTLLKLHDGVLTGVMMPCDLAKTSAINPTQATATIGQQLLSANNSSISLVHQFNSSNVHSPNMNAPHHFSSISSSGSLLIQQISGNTGQSPLINHINNSVMIAESTAMQSVINTQPATYPRSAPYLISAPPSTTDNSSTVNQVHPATACIVSNSQQNATYNPLPSVELSKPTVLQSKIVNIEKQVNIETKSTGDQAWSAQAIAQIVEEKAVIKVDTNSIVHDASNQTEDNDDKEEEEYTSEDVNDRNTDEEEPLKNEKEFEVPDDDLDKRKSKLKRATNEKKVYNDENPDFSGLQLLLNGIERVEHSGHTNTKEDADDPKEEANDSDKDTDTPAPNGLEILCALADQRFKEEKKISEESDDESSCDDFEKKSFRKSSKTFHAYKREIAHPKSEKKAKRFLSSKYSRHRLPSLSPCDDDSLEMRVEYAKLQKKYRETRKELSRLTHHRKFDRSSSRTSSPTPVDSYPPCDRKLSELERSVPLKRGPGRPRKYSLVEHADARRMKCDSDSCLPKSTIKPMKRPKLKLDTESLRDGSEDEVKVSDSNNGDLSPPVLEPMCTPPKAKSFKSDILGPPTLIASKNLYVGPKGLPDREHLWPSEFESKQLFRLSGDDLSDEDIFKAKDEVKHDRRVDALPVVKRKVGRPRKYPREDSELAKTHKPSTGSSIGHKKSASCVFKSSEKQIPVTSNVVSTFALLKSQRTCADLSLNEEPEHKPKITPKLKAEAKLRTWRQKSPDVCTDDLDFEPKKKKIESVDSLLRIPDRKSLPFLKRDKCHPKEKISSNLNTLTTNNPTRASLTSVSVSHPVNQFSNSTKPSSTSPTECCDKNFRITQELLDTIEKRPLRVLVPVGSLFRAGELSAVRPPDLYGIKLDGERGQKTHIYTKEEVLKDVVLEVRGKYPLRNGTRVCAFWSSQYQSLYPGYVTSFSSLDESEDENYTAVEFDDGDSGRIKMNDIRVLPKDIRIDHRKEDSDSSVEYAGRRKRRISSMSFDEIPVDKQLHSPERSAHRVKMDAHEGALEGPCAHAEESSPSKISADRFPEASESKSNKVEGLTVGNAGADKKQKNSERKKLKKKHKDKIRENSDSTCRRKSRKHRSDTDDGSSKGHKRHKRKHKHHKHHKRKRSHDTDRRESDSHKCSSNSHVRSVKVDKLLDEDADWTSVPPYSSHLTEAKKSEFSLLSKTSSPKLNDISPIETAASSEHETAKVVKKNIGSDEDNDDDVDVNKDGEEECKNAKESGKRDLSPSSTSSRRDSDDSTSDSGNSSEENKFWDWHGKGFKRNGKGRARKEFYKSIQRRGVIINVGDCAVFLTAGSSTKPFIGRIESMWESYGNMMVRVNWFYHPEETTGLKKELPFLGALFESPHNDKNDVQTISHKCDVVSIKEYRERLKKEPERIHNVYESNDLYYLAGYYDPTAKRLTFEDGVF